MVNAKKMDESLFAGLLKEINVYGELIRSRQEEKQSLMDEFDRESKRFYFGKISEKALSSSVEKTNKELSRIDKEIISYMKKSQINLQKATKFISDQEPKTFKATLSGVKDSRNPVKTSKKKPVKKITSKATKKKVVKKVAPKKVKKSKKVVTKKTVPKKKTSKKKKK